MKAKKHFERALKANEWDIPAWMGIGDYFERKNLHQAAILEYGKLRRKLPQCPEAWEAIGRCYRKTKDYTKSFEHYSQALELYQKSDRIPSEDMLYQMGWIAQYPLKQADGAFRIYQTHLQHYGNIENAWKVHTEIAQILKEKGGSQGLIWAHIAAGLAVAPENKEMKKASEKFRRAALAASDLVLMLKLKYSLDVMAQVISRTELGFTITTKEQVQELIKAGIPPEIVVMILKLQEQGRTAPRPQPTPDEPTNPPDQPEEGDTDDNAANQQKLVGMWGTKQGQNIIAMKIEPDGSFLEIILGPDKQELSRSTGKFRIINSQKLMVQMQTPRVVNFECMYRIQTDALDLQINGQWVAYQRLEGSGSSDTEDTSGTRGNAGLQKKLIGLWGLRQNINGIDALVGLKIDAQGNYVEVTIGPNKEELSRNSGKIIVVSSNKLSIQMLSPQQSRFECQFRVSATMLEIYVNREWLRYQKIE